MSELRGAVTKGAGADSPDDNYHQFQEDPESTPSHRPIAQKRADCHCHIAALPHVEDGMYLIATIDLDDIHRVEAEHDAYEGKRTLVGSDGVPGKVLRFGFGIHPMSVWKYSDITSAITVVRQALQARVQTQAVFVGEVGLDYRPAVLSKWPTPEEGIRAQLFALQQQVELAFAFCVPIEIHVVNRKPGCWDNLCSILSNAVDVYGSALTEERGDSVSQPHGETCCLPPAVVILHSFSGSISTYTQIRNSLNAAWQRTEKRARATERTERDGPASKSHCLHACASPRLYLSVSHLTDGNRQAEKAVSWLWNESPELLLLETDYTNDEEDYPSLWNRASEVLARCAKVQVSEAQQRAERNLAGLIELAMLGR